MAFLQYLAADFVKFLIGRVEMVLILDFRRSRCRLRPVYIRYRGWTQPERNHDLVGQLQLERHLLSIRRRWKGGARRVEHFNRTPLLDIIRRDQRL